MASNGSLTVSTSPKSGKGDQGAGVPSSSPKGQCLCSPTKHQGSFRCRIHRSSANWMKRSNSMPANTSAAATSPKSVDST
ncbi:hypothetical protein I3843_04G153700 [Carya illinoinensis]|uniref:Serine-rich protein n=1 Tax=Carya illinoinensis TaxID=32201 RepID=A0A8T1QWG8_CARIL|nr:hypothetical protein I3760_04G162100 [Carya illinoinensis]KAG6658483.1 hypothetical protein CIPAW_04G164800 [Carya illinoinensis]KAG7984312.1 hypothetical protein I3843_04G153700 [Carya illinoinensis]